MGQEQEARQLRASLLPTCCGLVGRVAKKSATSWQLPRLRRLMDFGHYGIYASRSLIGTRSSAVAVIADRTAYDEQYTGKLFDYKSTNGWYARSDTTGTVYERTQTLSTQAWPLSVTGQKFSSSRSQWITECNTTVHAWYVSRSHSFFSVRFVAKRYTAIVSERTN